MNITRAGFALLIVGLIILLNASTSRMSGHRSATYDLLDAGASQSYLLLIAPVGPANMCIGLHPERGSYLPPVFSEHELTDVPVHLEVTDPNNNIIVDKDVVTPYCFDINFNARGAYTVHVTNNGNATTEMPLGIIFDFHNPDNKEADKYLLSLVLTALGALLVAVGVVMKFVLGRSRQ